MKMTAIIVLLLVPFYITAQVNIAPYPDNSWDLPTYKYLGIPSIDTIWTQKELRQFQRYMEKIYREDKWSLPRKNSPYSGALFQKMTSEELLTPLLDKSQSIGKRIEYINLLFEYTNFIIVIYAEPKKKTERFGAELTDGYQFFTAVNHQARLFMDELQTTLPPNVVVQPEFKKMYNQMAAQLGSLLLLSLAVIDENANRIDQNILTDFTAKTAASIKENWELIPDEQHETIKEQLDTMKKHPIKPIKKELKSLLKTLE